MNPPPPVLDCAHVIEFAIADETVIFEQRKTLNVGGEWLGRVPCLAICQNFDNAEFLVFHCNLEWEALGVAAGYVSIEDAKQKMERSYDGLFAKWKVANYSRDDAVTYVDAQFKAQSCSFCGRNLRQVKSMAGDEADKVRICNNCVDGFYEGMHREFNGT